MPCIQVVESSDQSARSGSEIKNTFDIDDLVRKVSQTLKLKAKAKKNSMENDRRWMPYNRHSRNKKTASSDLDDPHKMLEELQRTGNLIKEAVARIRRPIERPIGVYQVSSPLINKTTTHNSD